MGVSCREEIRTATSSMTSVPKPLKFLRPHYGALKSYYEKMVNAELKVNCGEPLKSFGLFLS